MTSGTSVDMQEIIKALEFIAKRRAVADHCGGPGCKMLHECECIKCELAEAIENVEL